MGQETRSLVKECDIADLVKGNEAGREERRESQTSSHWLLKVSLTTFGGVIIIRDTQESIFGARQRALRVMGLEEVTEEGMARQWSNLKAQRRIKNCEEAWNLGN